MQLDGFLYMTQVYVSDILNSKLTSMNKCYQSTAKHGNLNAVQELLFLGAPHRPRSSDGELPIDFAKEFGHTDIEKYLGNGQLVAVH